MKCESQLMWDSSGLKFHWFDVQLISESNDLNSNDFRLNRFETVRKKSTDLKFKWFEIQLIYLTFNGFESRLIWNSNISSRQGIWDSIALGFSSFQTQLFANSIDLRFTWIEIHSAEMQLIWNSIGLRFKYWFQIQLIWHSFDLKLNCSIDFRLKMKAWQLEWEFPQQWSAEARAARALILLGSCRHWAVV